MANFALNDHFYDFVFDWEHFINLLVGGYGSSKSYHIATKIVTKLLEETRRAMVIRRVFETHRESTFSLIQEVCERMGLDERHVRFVISPMSVNFSNGSKIIFKGLDASEKLKSLNSISIVWVEECSEIEYSSYLEILGRLRHPEHSNHVLLSTNPVSKTNWVYKHFFISKDDDTGEPIIKLDDKELYQKRVIVLGNTYYHHSVVDDNYYAPQSYIDTLDELKSHDPDLYRIARMGHFGVVGLLVFPQIEVWSHDKVMKAIAEIKEPLNFTGMDFGFETSYNALLRMAVDHEEKILYLWYEYYSRGKTDPEIAEDIEHLKSVLIKADSAEPKAIRFYKLSGFRMKAAKKFQGSREQYTKKVKRFKKIIISTECPNAVEELEDLTFKKDKNGDVIEDEFNRDPHTLSAIWYGLDTYEVADLKKRIGMRTLQ